MKYWSCVILVLGVCLLAYGLSGISGGGDGSSWSFGYRRPARLLITVGAGLAAFGAVTRRRS
jgi:hypothetical protein